LTQETRTGPQFLRRVYLRPGAKLTEGEFRHRGAERTARGRRRPQRARGSEGAAQPQRAGTLPSRGVPEEAEERLFLPRGVPGALRDSLGGTKSGPRFLGRPLCPLRRPLPAHAISWRGVSVGAVVVDGAWPHRDGRAGGGSFAATAALAARADGEARSRRWRTVRDRHPFADPHDLPGRGADVARRWDPRADPTRGHLPLSDHEGDPRQPRSVLDQLGEPHCAPVDASGGRETPTRPVLGAGEDTPLLVRRPVGG
jgi:hypothetical protein